MNKETAERIAADILATKLGWVVALVDMTDPANRYSDDGWTDTARRRVAQEPLVGDYCLCFYETGVKAPKVKIISSEIDWLSFRWVVFRLIIRNDPSPDYESAAATWYPASGIVEFTDEWDHVPDMLATTKPTEADVSEWLKKHNAMPQRFGT